VVTKGHRFDIYSGTPVALVAASTPAKAGVGILLD
jgi:hypothetical protein